MTRGPRRSSWKSRGDGIAKAKDSILALRNKTQAAEDELTALGFEVRLIRGLHASGCVFEPMAEGERAHLWAIPLERRFLFYFTPFSLSGACDPGIRLTSGLYTA